MTTPFERSDASMRMLVDLRAREYALVREIRSMRSKYIMDLIADAAPLAGHWIHTNYKGIERVYHCLGVGPAEIVKHDDEVERPWNVRTDLVMLTYDFVGWHAGTNFSYRRFDAPQVLGCSPPRIRSASIMDECALASYAGCNCAAILRGRK